MKKYNDLTTPFEENMPFIPHKEYPRPQCRRDSYLCLNGEWDLQIVTRGGTTYDGKILVPFPIQSRLSGVKRSVGKHDRMYYSRIFHLNEDFVKDKTILHFGAVDQICRVFINGIPVGEHIGGYIPFSYDITKQIKIGENTLLVEVKDEQDPDLAYGKQCHKRGGMWYTPISGIWQTIWIESIYKEAITDIRIQSTVESATITVTSGRDDKRIIFQGEEYSLKDNSLTLFPNEPKQWSPEQPYLYEFEILSGRDSVKSYFALRQIEIDGNRILLNQKPYFFHGVLDQGYFSDGIYMPATPKGFENDILQMKSLGFNMLRKHIKIEPDLFYYYCDKYGMIVFQDMVNSGKYSFIRDTALPTIGFKKGGKRKASEYRKKHFEENTKDTVKLLYNHPCVCYYTIFNEGWGQYDADRLYDLGKSLDNSRVWDTTSGWFKETKSDVESEHVYFKPISLSKTEKPLVLSEFGGYSLKIKENSFNPYKTYGYKKFTNSENFEREIEKLYLEQIIPAIENGLCATVLTQLSDVEDETNGLLTYDRRILKINTAKMQTISKSIMDAYQKKHSKS